MKIVSCSVHAWNFGTLIAKRQPENCAVIVQEWIDRVLFQIRTDTFKSLCIFPSPISNRLTSTHCKLTLTHPSRSALVKIKAQISGKQTPHLRPVTHANNAAKHNIQCGHADTLTALTDWWLFGDFMHQIESNLLQTHTRECNFWGVGGEGLACIDSPCLFIRSSTLQNTLHSPSPLRLHF